MKVKLFLLLTCLAFGFAHAQQQSTWKGKFEQLDQMLPTPNSYRTGSGAPGPNYWQQRADYVLSAEVNDETQTLTGSGSITYYNNAPETMTYLWLQLDQNLYAQNSMTKLTSSSSIRDSVPAKMLASSVNANPYKGGFTVTNVKDESGKALSTTIN